jgi:hypothetical protein
MQKRRSILAGLFGVVGAGKVAQAAGGASDLERKIFEIPLFFTQRDTVVDFQPNTGLGLQVGTVEGLISGTSVVNFQFIPISQTEINFDNRALITDLDGDQIIFKNVGSGRFIVPPLSDPSSPLGNLMGIGGPLTGSYECIRASGKFSFLLGRKFPYRSVASNPARPGFPGQVYVEVYSDIIGGRQA